MLHLSYAGRYLEASNMKLMNTLKVLKNIRKKRTKSLDRRASLGNANRARPRGDVTPVVLSRACP